MEVVEVEADETETERHRRPAVWLDASTFKATSSTDGDALPLPLTRRESQGMTRSSVSSIESVAGETTKENASSGKSQQGIAIPSSHGHDQIAGLGRTQGVAGGEGASTESQKTRLLEP